MKKVTTSLLMVASVVTLSSALEVKQSGNVQFRLRSETNYELDSTGAIYDGSQSTEYTNKYLWNYKLGLKVNDNLAIKFRLSNPNGAALETVNFNGKFADSKNGLVALPQAEIKYNTGFFRLDAGILEVKGSTALTLATSAESNGYQKMDISNDWSVYANNSQTGLRVGFDFGDAIALNVVSAIAKYHKKDSLPYYANFRTIAELPITFGENKKFAVVPTFEVLSGISGTYDNRHYNTNGSIDFIGKFNKTFTLSAGAGYGLYYKVFNDTTTTWDKPTGLLLSVKPVVKFGDKLKNTVTLGYSFGRGADGELEGDAKYATLDNHIDFRWGLGIANHFTIMPRFRTWWFSDTKSSSDSSVKIRPEIIFNGSF